MIFREREEGRKKISEDDPKVYTCDVCGEKFWLRPSLKDTLFDFCADCAEKYIEIYVKGNVIWEQKESKCLKD